MHFLSWRGLVIEVLDFVESDKLLDSSSQILSSDNMINDINVAKNFAWDVVYGRDELTWADLRSEKMSKVWELIYEDEKYSEIDSKLSSMLDQLSHAIKMKLDMVHQELLDDILSDIQGCLYSRAVQGANNKFFEDIFAIYLNGCWPCGWKGKWPEGSALIYSPVKCRRA